MPIKGKQLADDSVDTSKLDTASGGISTINAGDAALEGSGLGVARRDHQHATATGGATADIQVADAAAEGSSGNLAREDHVHALPAPAAPANVDKSAAVAGASATVARADHKHDVDTASAGEITDSTNSEGVATSLARSDHGHAHGNRGGGPLHATATVLVNGFMTAVDKIKLDSLSAPTAIAVKDTVNLATTPAGGNLALTGEVTVDGTLTSNSRVLVKNQTDPIENGIYDTAAGAWTRAADFAAASTQSGAIVGVDAGAINNDSLWFMTSNIGADTVGTDAMNWALQAQGSPRMNGPGLFLNGNELGVGANADGSIVVNADDVQVGVLASDAQHGARGGGTQHADVVAGAPGTSGFMSGAAQLKLDGINAGAEVNRTSRQEIVATQLVTGTDTALIDTLQFVPASVASLKLYLNGVFQKQGAGLDYSISGQVITWLASTGTAVDMDGTDELRATYLS